VAHTPRGFVHPRLRTTGLMVHCWSYIDRNQGVPHCLQIILEYVACERTLHHRFQDGGDQKAQR